MLEVRNKFINEMTNRFASHKKRFHNLINNLGWTIQSVSGNIKEECDEHHLNPEVDYFVVKEQLGEKYVDCEHEGCSFSLNGIQSRIYGTLCLGTSKDSEKRYNELLASLSFQPKVKKEKLSDTQLLASLLESERNAKRRRISYRNKVHTKNKSHTQVLREVIREQMEILKDEGEENDDGNSNTNSIKKHEDDEMFEVREIDGNPHLAWQNISLAVEEKKERERDYSKHSNDRQYSGSSNRQKYHSRRGHSPKYHERSSHRKDSRSRSPHHSRSRYSNSKRLPSRERHHNTTNSRHSRHKRHDH